METTHPKHGGANVRFPPPLVFLAGLLGGIAAQHFAPVALGLAATARTASGTLIAVAGVAFAGWARGRFTRTGQDPAPWRPSPSLIGGGPYRFSRNPMYVGMTALVFGVGLALGNPWMMGFAFVALAAVHLTAVLPEERYLGEKFGDDYARFRASVRRYF